MVLEPPNFGEMKGETFDFGHKTTTKNMNFLANF